MTTSFAAATLLAAPHGAQAQQPIDSTTALKEACEAGDHFISVTTDLRISTGPHEEVASGCQIVLGPAASFEADQVSMRFAGPFRIDTSRERSIVFNRSAWEAPSLEFHGGDVGSFKSVASRLWATGGDIQISMGRRAESSCNTGRPALSMSWWRPARSP